MVSYTCLTCDKIFMHKGTYYRHKQRKNPCQKSKINLIDETDTDIEETDIEETDNEFGCRYCKHEFSTKSNLVKHLNDHCKVKKETDLQNTILLKVADQMKQQQDELAAQIKKQQEDIDNLKKKMDYEKQNITNNTNNTQNNITNTNTINNNIQQNIIQIIPFGKEKLDLTDRQLVRFLRKCYNSVPELINFKHFNEKIPENCNVYIPNSKCSHARVYTGDQWEIRDTCDVIHQLFEDNNDYLIDKFKEKEEELDEMTKRKFSKYLSKQEDKKVIGGVKRNIKHNLYNKKHIPLSINNEK